MTKLKPGTKHDDSHDYSSIFPARREKRKAPATKKRQKRPDAVIVNTVTLSDNPVKSPIHPPEYIKYILIFMMFFWSIAIAIVTGVQIGFMFGVIALPVMMFAFEITYQLLCIVIRYFWQSIAIAWIISTVILAVVGYLTFIKI